MKHSRLGSSYIELPKEIVNKKACINIQNNDEACIAWAITAALQPANINKIRTASYPHYSTVLNLEGVEFPAKLKHIPRIEIHKNISLNVYGFEFNGETKVHEIVRPLHLSKTKRDTHHNLLLVEKAQKFDYVLITDMSRLISASLSHK